MIRIVHSNGRVEEISGSVKASDVMKLYPKHILKKPCSTSSSTSSDDGAANPKIAVVPPDADLQRGKIYFLTPAEKKSPAEKTKSKKKREASSERNRDSRSNSSSNNNDNNSNHNHDAVMMANLNILSSDRYLSDILSEKLSTQRDRRRGRVAVWRPHLESITESPIVDL